MKPGWTIAALAQAAAAMLLVATAPNVPAQDAPQPEVTKSFACAGPQELLRLDHSLPRTASRIGTSQPLRIVAIGSSSTFGAGASSPAMSYPARLEAELKTLWPRTDVTVLNRGVNGETARDMLARFDNDVFADTPDLVLWQVGSNSVLRDQPLAPAGALLQEGLGRLKAAGLDVALINPQYAPKVITKHDIDGMVDLIDATARRANVNLFQRFALMRYWRLTEDMPFSSFLSTDELHMNDWSYGCLAKLLAGSIQDATKRPVVTAKARR